jgi:hypothetical protein
MLGPTVGPLRIDCCVPECDDTRQLKFLEKPMKLIILTFAFAMMGAAPKSISLESSAPSDLLQIVEGWRSLHESGEVLLTAKEQKTYENELETLTDYLNSRDSWEGMTEKERIAFVNRYEKLRAMTDGGEARGNRRVCTRERRPGSNFKHTVCVTAAEQARIDKLNRAALSDIERNGRRQSVSGQ